MNGDSSCLPKTWGTPHLQEQEALKNRAGGRETGLRGLVTHRHPKSTPAHLLAEGSTLGSPLGARIGSVQYILIGFKYRLLVELVGF